ncbi:Uncharacterised protein [Raoultella terrigena]|uniref:Translocation and assembly module TamB n=1 Tax=Raoultella terrigena TaxID=577 RepID=A0A3P8KL49_RAOTE|nr:Uncharacterised protein [Raoultella terrigena]
MSLWKKISLGVMLFLVLLLGTVGFLVGTTSGLHLVLKAADRWVPGLEIGKVTGGWRDLTLENVRFTQPGVAVTAGQFHLAVKLRCLWDSSLCVNDISLRDIYVAIDTAKMPPSAPPEEEDTGPLNLSTPYPITLSRVALQNVNVKIDDTAVSVRDFSTGLRWQEKNLTLTPTSLQGLLIALPKVAKVAQEQIVEPKIEDPQPQEKPLGETMKALFEKPVLPEMADVHLPLNLNIEEFRGEQLRITGDTDMTIYSLLLKVSSIDGQMTLDTLDVDSDQGKVTASGSAQLQDSWPVDITLNGALNIDPLKGEKVQLKVGGEMRKKLTVGVDLAGPVAMTLRAEAQLAEAGLPLNMELKSKQLYWPFSGEKQFQADDLQLTFSGKMTDYALAMSTVVKGQSLPPAKISLNAKGNEQQVNIDKLTVAALEGKTELKALLDWQQAISWRGELTLDGINTAKEVPDWPSKLNGLIKTQGSLYGGSWQMSVPELKITGNVKQNKVDVSGSLQGNSYMQWKIPGLHLALGPNSADVKGELGVKDLDLDATIDARISTTPCRALAERRKGW